MCPNCKGSGKQDFHRPFYSYRGTCNFCNGEGTLEAFKRIFAERMKGGEKSDHLARKPLNPQPTEDVQT